jgi:hypothetical protein
MLKSYACSDDGVQTSFMGDMMSETCTNRLANVFELGSTKVRPLSPNLSKTFVSLVDSQYIPIFMHSSPLD